MPRRTVRVLLTARSSGVSLTAYDHKIKRLQPDLNRESVEAR
jgi:hypothetical protein